MNDDRKTGNISQGISYFRNKFNRNLEYAEMEFIDDLMKNEDLYLIFNGAYELPFLTQDRQNYLEGTKLEMIYNLFLFDNNLNNRLEALIKQFDKNIKYNFKNFFLGIGTVSLTSTLNSIAQSSKNVFYNRANTFNNDKVLGNLSLDTFVYNSYVSDGLKIFSKLEGNNQDAAISGISKGQQNIFRIVYNEILYIRNYCAHPRKAIYKEKLGNIDELIYLYRKTDISLYGLSSQEISENVQRQIQMQISNSQDITFLPSIEDFLIQRLKQSPYIMNLYNEFKNLVSVDISTLDDFFNIRVLDLFLLNNDFLININPLNATKLRIWLQNKLPVLISDWPESSRDYFLSKLTQLITLI